MGTLSFALTFWVIWMRIVSGSHWSSLSDMFVRAWSSAGEYEVGVRSDDYFEDHQIAGTGRPTLEEAVDRAAVEDVSGSSLFSRLFSWDRSHCQEVISDSIGSDESGGETSDMGKFATLRTTEVNTIPWTPMTRRSYLHQIPSLESGGTTEKSLLTTFTPVSIDQDQFSRRSILPSAVNNHALRGHDKTAIVKSKFGQILGNVNGNHRSFLGIPYAVPPVGPNRWRAAKMLTKFMEGGVLDARKFGSHCMQLNTWESSYFRELMVGLKTEPSEDCLTLNIYTPTKARLAKIGSKLPVMVFIHGGQYTTGGTSANIYDATNFVERNDVVVVSMNYRISIWGFLAGLELAEDSSAVGNYAMTDVIAALQWVKRFIRSFGGDSDNVTLAGHSAGANMVNYLVIALGQPAYVDHGLIHRAVLFSGAVGTGLVRDMIRVETDVTLQPLFDRLAHAVGCGDVADRVACLRQTRSEDLAKVGVEYDWAYHWSPVVGIADGLVPGEPMDLMRDGSFLPVPILVTDTLDDGTIFSVGEPTVTYDDYIALIQKYFGPDASHAIAEYYGRECNLDGTPFFQAASKVLRDALITCPLDQFGGLAALKSPAPVYYFRFYKPLSVAWLVSALPGIPDYGVFHGTELILLFQGLSSLTIGQAHAINHVQRRIVSFMTGGKPDDPKYPDENPALRMKAPLDMDKICYQWDKWPLNPQFLENKMGLGSVSQSDLSSALFPDTRSEFTTGQSSSLFAKSIVKTDGQSLK